MSEPLSRAVLLSRGKCCHHRCKNCPYKYMYNLFLDDVRKPKDVTWVELPLVEWVIVRNAEQFVAYIKLHGCPSKVAFDHDLAPEHYSDSLDWSQGSISSLEPTGYECVKWLVDYCINHKKDFPEYYLHTLNPIGKQNMESYIKSHNKIKEANE